MQWAQWAVCVFMSALVLSVPSPAQAQAVEIGDAAAVRISKSSIVRLADDEHQISEKSVYLPAGKRLVLFKNARLINKKHWQLAMTSDGLFVYVRTDGVHYFDMTGKAAEFGGRFAVVTKPFRIERGEGTDPILLSPSEIYPVDDAGENGWRIQIGKDKVTGPSPNVTEFFIPEDVLSVFDEGDMIVVASDSADFGFRQQTFRDGVKSIIEEISNLDLDKESFKVVENYLLKDVIAEKGCDSEITLKPLSLSGSLEASTKSMLLNAISPLAAEVNAAAAFSFETEYPKATEFKVERYFRRAADGEGELYSLRSQSVRDDCSSHVKNRRIIIRDSEDTIGEINNELAKQKKLDVDHEGSIIIRCRDDYIRIYDALVGGSGIRADIVSLALAKYASYAGGRDGSVCSDRQDS